MEHRVAETGKLGKRMRCFDLEMPQAEIVNSTQLANVGISDGHLTGLAPGTAQERERRIVESDQLARTNHSS